MSIVKQDGRGWNALLRTYDGREHEIRQGIPDETTAREVSDTAQKAYALGRAHERENLTRAFNTAKRASRAGLVE